MTTETIHCECGVCMGERCAWEGDESETVEIEWMPEQHRASHVAAGNRGVYPRNGARRLRVHKDCADYLIQHDGEWTSLVA